MKSSGRFWRNISPKHPLAYPGKSSRGSWRIFYFQISVLNAVILTNKSKYVIIVQLKYLEKVIYPASAKAPLFEDLL